MKITLEPTIRPPLEGIPLPTISISFPSDDMSAHAVLEELIVPALEAAGYNPNSIEDAFIRYLSER